MSFASGSRVDMAYVAEVTRGTTPNTPTTKLLRLTQRNINLTKGLLESQEVRADRELADQRHGQWQVSGQLGFELSLTTFNDMLEAALSGTWTAITLVSPGNLTLATNTASTATLTRASGSFTTDGVQAGDQIKLASFTNTANNGTFPVLTVGSNTAVIGLGCTAEGPVAATATIPGKRLSVGTTLRTFTMERRFNDIAQYQAFPGVAVNKLSLSIKPNQIVTGAMDMLGMNMNAMSGTSICASPTAAATNSPFASFDGAIYEGGSVIGIVTGLDLALDNQRQLGAVVGSKFSPDVFEGNSRTTGSLGCYFQNATMFNKFVNETSSSIYCKLNDLNGTDWMNIVANRVKYNGAPIDPPNTGPVICTMPIACLRDSTTGVSLSIQRSDT